VDAVPLYSEQIELAETTDMDSLIDQFAQRVDAVRSEAEGRAAILRLELSGRTPLHGDLNDAERVRELAEHFRQAESHRDDFVWVEEIVDRSTPPIDIAQRRQFEDFVGDFLRASHAIREEREPSDGVRKILATRNEYPKIVDALDEFSSDELAAMLEQAESIGLDYLLKEET